MRKISAERVAVLRVLHANMLKFMGQVFPGASNKVLKDVQKYILGDEFYHEVFINCSSNLDYYYETTSMVEYIAAGKYYAGDWYHPPEWEEVYIDAPGSFAVEVEGSFDSLCIAKTIVRETSLVIDPLLIYQNKNFAKLVLDAILFGIRNHGPELMETLEDLEMELGDEWHHESSHRLDGNFSVTDIKAKKGKVKKSGSKIVFIIKFDAEVTMEDIELDNSPDY